MSRRAGFTLVELIIGAAVLAIAIAALLGAFLGQITLNEHARNLTWAMNDANRVMERLRQVNTGCAAPSTTPPGFATWDAWLFDPTVNGGGGKSIQPDPLTEELIVVEPPTGNPTSADPLQITVAVCWRHRGRTLGECTWNGAALTWADGTAPYTNNGVPESPAMLTTLMTCRQ